MKTKLASSIIGIVLTLTGDITTDATPKYSHRQTIIDNERVMMCDLRNYSS